MAFCTQTLNHKGVVQEERGQEEDVEKGTPVKYVPLCDVYSATSPCSKKVKARKLQDFDGGLDNHNPKPLPSSSMKPPLIHVYSRCRKRKSSFYDSLVVSKPVLSDNKDEETTNKKTRRKIGRTELIKLEIDSTNNSEGKNEETTKKKKRRRNIGCTELIRLGIDSSVLRGLDGPRLRGNRNHSNNNRNNNIRQRRNRNAPENGTEKVNSGSIRTKRWVRLSFGGVDLKKFIGLQCQVYWPLDAAWYSGRIVGYDSGTDRHHVKYEDDDEEYLILSNERIKIFISPEEMKRLKLSYNAKSSDTDDPDANEMVVLAASLDDCHELEPGDIVWAKLTGYAMWPAVVVDESFVGNRKGLNKISGEKTVIVQFFGTHDFARVRTMQVISFLRGLLSSFHQKCKKLNFVQSLEEAKMYLSKQKLPKRMLRLRNGIEADDCESSSGDDECGADSGGECMGDGRACKKWEGIKCFPFDIGDLQIMNLGKIVKDSDYFQDEKFIWPEGYTALRKFTSITDPNISFLYKMEVLRDSELKTRPLFRVTSDTGEQFRGATPSACWKKIYKRIKKMQFSSFDGLRAEDGSERIFESGSYIFGFSHPEVLKLIQELSKSKYTSKVSKLTPGRYQDLPFGYRPVRVQWKDLDKCSVCHMDEEYENNLFLQCDKCRMMVHARCYGELEPVDGILWLCNLCRSGAPEFPPPCCLCPVIGGAMKPTTDGRWAHLACAIWIPETCLSDIKKMEPIDGLSRINKDRWKLLCSICGVSYGACIQCSNNACYMAYHPLCARAAGFCVELEDEDRLHLIPIDEDEDDQCIRLLSFCKKHRPPSNERLFTNERIGQIACQHSDYTPPPNPSGCARSEPYNYFGRRGRKEPEALAAASLKRLFLEDRPCLVGGYCQHELLGNTLSSNALVGSKYSFALQKLKAQLDASNSILSMAEKYKYMKETFRKRLAFGKSRIHGFGIFAKHPHRAGDMVIEYTGELVRPPIADRREHLIYNSLVGAGTYMFRIDDERVIDATRAGSIAHLINHSCEPNCYSRVISVNADEHIIIFAKRDIKQWEELTYDYRFFSIDEQLACYCGFPRCRGVVNDIEAEGQVAKLSAPRSELVDWRGE